MNAATQANIIVAAAIRQMVNKSGASEAEIMATIAADPHGNTSRYFRDLLALGVRMARDGAIS